MANGQEAAEGAQAWIWVGAAPLLVPSSVGPFLLSVSRGGSGGGSCRCRASPEVADADPLRATAPFSLHLWVHYFPPRPAPRRSRPSGSLGSRSAPQRANQAHGSLGLGDLERRRRAQRSGRRAFPARSPPSGARDLAGRPGGGVGPHLQGQARPCPSCPFSPNPFRGPHSPEGGGTKICSGLWHRGGPVSLSLASLSQDLGVGGGEEVGKRDFPGTMGPKGYTSVGVWGSV